MLLLISILSPLIPIIAGFRNRSNTLWWYSICSILNDCMIPVIRKTLGAEISVSSNIFAICEFILLLFYYKNRVFRRDTLFYFVLFVNIFLFLALTSSDTGWLTLNRLGISIFMIQYIGLSIAGFLTILRQQKIVFLERSSFFWSNVAILTYSSGAFFLFLFTIHITDSEDWLALYRLWGTLFLSLNILKNILLGIALSKKEES